MDTRLVCVSHGKFAKELIESAKMIAGGMDDILVFSLMPGVSMPEFRAQIAAGLEQAVSEGAKRFLCLADLYGGTPSTALISLIKDFDMEVVTGLNLAMLIEVYFAIQAGGDQDFAELAVKTLGESGRVVRPSDFE